VTTGVVSKWQHCIEAASTGLLVLVTFGFQMRLHSRNKELLASSCQFIRLSFCPSVRLSAFISAA